MPCTDPRAVMSVSQGIAHQYAAYSSPCGMKPRACRPNSVDATPTSAQKAKFAMSALATSRCLSRCFLARSAAIGNSAKLNALNRYDAISENLVAM